MTEEQRKRLESAILHVRLSSREYAQAHDAAVKASHEVNRTRRLCDLAEADFNQIVTELKTAPSF